MSFEKIKSAVESGKFDPVYFLSGEESYYIDQLTELILNKALSPAQRDFNQHIFYGKDSEPQEILNAARRYPAFAERQIVLLKEAQVIRDFEPFIPYIKQPVPSTILIFNYKHKKVDKRKAFGKLVSKTTTFLESAKLKEDKVPDWIISYLRSNNRKINPKSAFLLKEHLGNDLAKIVNEVDKLLLSVPEGIEIDANHIEEHIGISKDFNAFELSAAIGRKDYLKSIGIIKYFEKNPKAGPLIFVLAILYGYFSKIYQIHHCKGMSDSDIAKTVGVNPYFFKDYKQGAQNYPLKKTEYIISLIAETDARNKGIGGTNNVGPYELLKELIFKMMH